MARDDELRDLDPQTRESSVRDSDDWQTNVVAARHRFSADALVGMTVARARVVVEAAGGEFASDEGPIRTKLDTNRLIARVKDGRVVGTSIG